jgi:hypothetical protein
MNIHAAATIFAGGLRGKESPYLWGEKGRERERKGEEGREREIRR